MIRVGKTALIGAAMAVVAVVLTGTARLQAKDKEKPKAVGKAFKLDFVDWSYSDKNVRVEDLQFEAKKSSLFGYQFKAMANFKNLLNLGVAR